MEAPGDGLLPASVCFLLQVTKAITITERSGAPLLALAKYVHIFIDYFVCPFHS